MCTVWKAKEAKHSHTNIFECTRCTIRPQHCEFLPNTTVGHPLVMLRPPWQHSTVRPFNANWASVAPRARTARLTRTTRHPHRFRYDGLVQGGLGRVAPLKMLSSCASILPTRDRFVKDTLRSLRLAFDNFFIEHNCSAIKSTW